MHTLTVELGSRSYQVLVGDGLLLGLADLAGDLVTAPRALVVTDDNVAQHHLAGVVQQLQTRIPRVDACVLPAGEVHKTAATLQRLWDAALAVDADRRMLIVALGGGVVGDLAGFAAATVLRGVRVLQLPTSLLAQVDASVGGKTAINTAVGKNLVGAFKQPSLVVADVAALATLPPRELRNGLGEVVKHAAILDAALLGTLRERARDLLNGDRVVTADVVRRCVQLKAGVVQADEHETGRRKILNYGHTIGHAIEQLSGYGVVGHGEAVAIGMVAAAKLGVALGVGSSVLVDELEATLRALELPTRLPPSLDREALAERVAHDKKVSAQAVDFVLCPRAGYAVVMPIALEQVRAWLRQADL